MVLLECGQDPGSRMLVTQTEAGKIRICVDRYGHEASIVLQQMEEDCLLQELLERRRRNDEGNRT